MIIQDNVIKEYLKNVYFITGTPCGGKTTISRELAKRHNLVVYDIDEQFPKHQQISNPTFQASMNRQFRDADKFFGRTVEEYKQWLIDNTREQLDFVLLDLIRLSQNQIVLCDCHLTVEEAEQLTDPSRIVFLIKDPSNLVDDYCNRPDHQGFRDYINSTSDTQKAKAVCNETLKCINMEKIEAIKNSKYYWIERDVNSTIDKTLIKVEQHLFCKPVVEVANFRNEKKNELRKIYEEEDLFPREITKCIHREYGILFYDETNKDSYDSNHAIIFKDRINDLEQVLDDVKAFYKEIGVKPIIYQSIFDEGYFENNKELLLKCGFENWIETQKYMILSTSNAIIPNADVVVQIESEWKNEYGIEIFEKAGEPWEIDVIKKALRNRNTLFFVAYYNDKPVGMTHCHVTNDVCRVDYLLVSKEYRKMRVGRTIIYHFVEYCKKNDINLCYLWPDGDTAEKIYYEAGFRTVEIRQAGRAMLR